MKTSLGQFKEKLFGLGHISDESWSAFASCLSPKSFVKGQNLVEFGAIEDYIYYILTGAVKVYVPHKDKEICTNFRFDNQFTSSVTSFIERTPSEYTITALTDTSTLAFSHDDLTHLYNTYPEINFLGRRVMEQLLIDKRQRELNFLMLSAKERYLKMMEEYPKYVQFLTSKNLASYLGITPESLSRIRGKRR